MLKAVLFDMDGTLGDTLPLCVEAYRQCVAELTGRTPSAEEVVSWFGLSDRGVLGALLGMIIVWYVDQKRNFSTEGVWYVQILKTALGLLLALAVKEGLKLPLEALFGGHMIGRAIRYLALVLFAGILWPMTFPWFQKLGRKDEA